MRVRVSYPVEVTDRERLAIAYNNGTKGRLATREEVALYFQQRGTDAQDWTLPDLLDQIDAESAEMIASLKGDA